MMMGHMAVCQAVLGLGDMVVTGIALGLPSLPRPDEEEGKRGKRVE